MDNEPTGKARGGLARANSLSGDQRKEIAQAAASALGRGFALRPLWLIRPTLADRRT
jgi:hypothetical protein